MPRHQKTISLDGFVGINNRLRPEKTPARFLKEATNVDIDKAGGIRSRDGYSRVDSGSFHSLWSDGFVAYAVKDGDLVEILPNLQIKSLGVTISDRIRFWRVDEVTYYVGDLDKGYIKNGQAYSWGIDNPNPTPNLFSTTGSMTPGVYQVSVTYVTSGGIESGSGVAKTITLGANSGILVTNIPVSPNSEVSTVRVYVSTPDGEELYLVKEISNGTTSTVITDVSSAILPLQSFNYVPPPNGQVIAHYNGRMLIGQDNILWYSEPFSHHWFSYHTNYLVFPERIRAIMPVESGIWVASDNIYYLSGEDITTCRRDLKETAVAVEGTEANIPGHFIIIENTPIGYKWLITTDRGIFICFNQGVILNTVEANYFFDKADLGSGSFIQSDGIAKYVPIVKKKADAETTSVSDLAVGTIIRNGVTLEEDQ